MIQEYQKKVFHNLMECYFCKKKYLEGKVRTLHLREKTVIKFICNNCQYSIVEAKK